MSTIEEPDKSWYPCRVCGCSGYDEQIDEAITRLKNSYKSTFLTFEQASAWDHLENLRSLSERN